MAGGSAGSATGTGVATKWSGNNDNSVEERRGRGEMTGLLPSGSFLPSAYLPGVFKRVRTPRLYPECWPVLFRVDDRWSKWQPFFF